MAEDDCTDQHPECLEALRQIHLYLDGELTAEVRQQIGAHLSACPPCGSAYGVHEAVRHLVERSCRAEVPPEMVQRVRSAIEAVAGEAPSSI
ncbi:MAG TPA: mycothiol system anti-sigma-R factor [Acidimicrobiales bacterium]|jgi:mycothiol system anti-sigma-R factor